MAKVYVCEKCFTVVEANSTPSNGGCPAGGLHRWMKITDNGSLTPQPGYHAYQHPLVSQVVYAKSKPLSIKGKSWHRLT